MLAYLPAHPKLAPVRQYLTDRSGLERSHWREGLNALIVSFVAFAVTILVLAHVLQIHRYNDADDFESMVLRQDILQFAREMIPIGMFFVSTYIYQYDLWARHRRAAKLAAKAKAQEPTQKRSPTRKVPAPNPVDQDLNKLRGESGMSRMKTARPTQPNPELPEWYVFRSGNAEGPYTKLQLLDVQKISDRTKVRRGEAEWQRAGEIPELAAYLTEK
ncbi:MULTISPECIES: DUF4339 domain-containing protein [unclassified Microcoleus]|uniref:DUF4339 domain-containing protein n=1 Tax=unclassified Microcoleus TaxID=2642155 RepID=UPI002FD6990E